MPTKRIDFKQVRANASFETVAAHYGLTLEGKGEQRSALCCFHKEDTASLKIHLGKKLFHCFACEAKGNVLDFVTRMEGGNPDDAKQLREGASKLAEICGIEVGAGPRRIEPQRKAVVEPTKTFPTRPAQKAETASEEGGQPPGNKPLSFELKLDPTHSYLTERVPQNLIETFGLGYCSRGMMKGRIAIPIHNEQGELIAYAGRWAEKEVPKATAKYLLPDGFAKQLTLFNLHRLSQGLS